MSNYCSLAHVSFPDPDTSRVSFGQCIIQCVLVLRTGFPIRQIHTIFDVSSPRSTGSFTCAENKGLLTAWPSFNNAGCKHDASMFPGLPNPYRFLVETCLGPIPEYAKAEYADAVSGFWLGVDEGWFVSRRYLVAWVGGSGRTKSCF
jgi:hypothetical protein